MKTKRIVIISVCIVFCIAGSLSVMAAVYDPLVEKAQKQLTELGYDPGPVDGKMGNKTSAAIREFQSDTGLLVTGKLNEATLLKLGIEFPQQKPEAPASPPEKQDRPIADLIESFEQEILSAIQNEEIRQAVIAVTEYENALLARYTPPTFQQNLFQNEADHLSFQSFFPDWKATPLEDMEIPMVKGLLSLEGENEDDALVVLSMGLGQIQQRMGVGDQDLTTVDDHDLLFSTQMLIGNARAVKTQEFQRIGKHRILLTEFENALGQPSLIMASLGHGMQFYGFLLSSSVSVHEENRQNFFELLKTIHFDYHPADENGIEAIRKNSPDQDAPEALLRRVAQLAMIGEYDAASEELGTLRAFLSTIMPRPFIKDNVAYHPAYGITLTNPDREKWELATEEAGLMSMIILQDKWSIQDEGIAIAALDFILTHGPQIVDMIEDEESHKQLLIGSGRGSTSGATIESERMTMVKQYLAYEATLSPHNGMKGRNLTIMPSGFTVLFIMFATEANADEKFAEYNRIIQGDWLMIEQE